eukprot:TRINITY_DN24078_c0_g1_i1.p3 TRINITY_DN24078_c0_g1~~TRINITY_DN24078_c0_g1_i1.p3  ORF type:complete len:151 (+),score=29.53 TRINITY_DN24078_c0_g1_i1:197-649(+)
MLTRSFAGTCSRRRCAFKKTRCGTSSERRVMSSGSRSGGPRSASSSWSVSTGATSSVRQRSGWSSSATPRSFWACPRILALRRLERDLKHTMRHEVAKLRDQLASLEEKSYYDYMSNVQRTDVGGGGAGPKETASVFYQPSSYVPNGPSY